MESAKRAQEEANLAQEAAQTAVNVVKEASQGAEEMHTENMDDIVGRFLSDESNKQSEVNKDQDSPSSLHGSWTKETAEIFYEKWNVSISKER